MDNHLLSLLIRVLASIGYQEDKQLFAKKFIWVCEKQALDRVVGKLPKSQQTVIYHALNEDVLSDQSKAYIMTVLQSKPYQDAVLAVFQENLESYIETVAPTLTEEQARGTEKILKEYL